jgi:flagellar motor switch protein FliM
MPTTKTKSAIPDNDQLDEAREVLLTEQQARVRDCQVELQAVLDKHRCRLDVSVLLRQGQVIPQVQIVAN